MINDIDRKILRLLQENSKISNAELARKLKMAASSIFERIKQLEAKGIITEYTTKFDCNKLGCSLIAFLLIKTTERAGEVRIAKKIALISEVQEVHHVAGEDCYLVKIRVSDNKALADLIRNHLGKIDEISSTRTTIVLETIKETGKINIV
ncbi:MAG: Lrp/AsnC family transcriptional regulator [Candidatus Lokiarchaeota archaeon]|nr:Lrp/AsnC family transcriptional regulator [Candidatus Lokiarchaeota archaeon]